jgi:ubiquinone/menaquinone biosynthesis C-methylase UbiE
MAENPSHPLFAAVYDPLMQNAEEQLLPRHREYLARDLSGRVLDVGSGTGAMFPYFVALAGEVEFHGVEPDPHMRKRARREARTIGLPIDLRERSAESLPYPDDHFDVVVAGLVFCTIPDPEAALEEIGRVLKPGGEFRFLEHVHDVGWRARLQSVVEPAWEQIAGGCRLTRETGELFTGHEAFEVVDFERFELGAAVVRPFVRGTLVRRED